MKTQTHNNFWQRLHKYAKEKSFPLRVMFELTYRCNFRCKHCYLPANYRNKFKPELKTQKVFSILNQLKEIGCFYLGFTGGEPFMRRDLLTILKYAKSCGFQVIIYTNGSLIDERLADGLASLKLNKVDITIPAMSKEAFERISGVRGSWEKVFKAIDLLYKRKVNLGFKTCILKENSSQIQQIIGFAASLHALHRLDDMPHPCLDGSKAPYKYRGSLSNALSVKEHPRPAKRQAATLLKENCDLGSDNLNTQTLFKCGVGVNQAAITPKGELKMCLLIDSPRYNILDVSLKTGWQRLKALVSTIKPDENYRCPQCEFVDYCKWCPARSWLDNKKFTHCDPESLRRAELIKGNYENRS